MIRTRLVFLITFSALLASCGGGSSNSSTASSEVNTDNDNEAASLSSLQDFTEPSRNISNIFGLTPVLTDDGAYVYSFETDAEASLELFGNPGTVTLMGAGGVIAVSPENSDSSQIAWRTIIDAGSWDVRYESQDPDTSEPIALVEFLASRYSLYTEASSRLLESGLELLFRASIVSDADIGDLDSPNYGQQQIPQQANFVVTITYNSLVNLEPVSTNVDVSLLDNGSSDNGDLVAGDGLYSAIVTLTNAGGYFAKITADNTVGGLRIQRDSSVRVFGVTEFRARLANDTTEATPSAIFNPAVVDQGNFIIPLPIRFTSERIPSRLDVGADLWGVNSDGEQVLINEGIGSQNEIIVDRGDGTYVFPVFLSRSNVTSLTGQYSDINLRNISIQSSDEGIDTLLGAREIQVTGLP